MIHQPYDKLNKTFLREFANEIFELLDIDDEVDEFLATEIITIDNNTKFIDFLIKTLQGRQIHVEFHSSNISKDMLYRNESYTFDLTYITKKDSIPIIISLGDRDKSYTSHETAYYSYKPLNIFLREFDGDKHLNILKNKAKNNEKFDGKDIFYLVFLPFTSHEGSDKSVAKFMFSFVNEINLSQKQKIKIKKCQKIILQIFFDNNLDEMKKLDDVINMECTYFREYEKNLIETAIGDIKKDCDALSDEVTVLNEKNTVLSDENTVLNEKVTVLSDEVTVLSDEVTVLNEKNTVLSDDKLECARRLKYEKGFSDDEVSDLMKLDIDVVRKL